jgi:hypothetical protein
VPHTVYTANPSSEATPSSMLKASADDSIVITLAPGLTMEKLQAQSIRRLNCLDKSFLTRRDKTTTLKLLVYGLYIGSIVFESTLTLAGQSFY